MFYKSSKNFARENVKSNKFVLIPQRFNKTKIMH